MENLKQLPKKKSKPYSRKLSDVGRSSISENRKLAQASRTLKACELCRKQKTRCFRSPDNPLSCLRCTFLNKPCSFETSPDALPTVPENGSDPTSKKLDMIYSGISEVLRLLKQNDGQVINDDTRLMIEAATALREGGQDNVTHHAQAPNHPDFDEHPTFQSPTNSLKASPFSVITNQVAGNDIPAPILNLLNLSTIHSEKNEEDILSLKILTEDDAIELLSDFRRNYGRWVSFPKNLETKELVERIRLKSPLLLTTCCCLSLRFSFNTVSEDSVMNQKLRTYRQLGKQLIKEVNRSLMRYTSYKGDNDGDIEFLQSLVILSLYSFSLTSILNGVGSTREDPSDQARDDDLEDLNLDPWFLSSTGLTLFLSKSTFGKLFQGMNSKLKNSMAMSLPFDSPTFLNSPSFLPTTPHIQTQSILLDSSDSNEYQMLTILRIYNHLCLVHLVNCVFSGRMCVIDEIRLNYCTSTLGLTSSTNFDGRMISEIGILLITYNFIQLNLNNSGGEGNYISLEGCEDNFKAVQEELRIWHGQWEYLINQAPLQFVELNYDFCTLIVYYTYNYQHSLLVTTGSTISQLDERSSLYDENHIDFIFRFSTKESLIKMIEHSYNVVKFINVIESDSYFAYLSDQIHFCFYFSGICLIKLLKFVSETKQTDLLPQVRYASVTDDDPLAPFIADLRILIHKFKIVGQNNNVDVLTKYEQGLCRGLKDITEK